MKFILYEKCDIQNFTSCYFNLRQSNFDSSSLNYQLRTDFAFRISVSTQNFQLQGTEVKIVCLSVS